MRNTEKYSYKWFDYYSKNEVKDLVESKLNSCDIKAAGSMNYDFEAKHEIDQFIDESVENIYCKFINRCI